MFVKLPIIVELQDVDSGIVAPICCTEPLEKVVAIAKDLTSQLLWLTKPANRAVNEQGLEVGAMRERG